MNQAKPLPLEERLARYLLNPRPRLRKRLVHAVNRAYGHALTLRGAAKKSAMRKLAGMPLDNFADEDTLLVIRDPKWFTTKKERVPE